LEVENKRFHCAIIVKPIWLFWSEKFEMLEKSVNNKAIPSLTTIQGAQQWRHETDRFPPLQALPTFPKSLTKGSNFESLFVKI
jgi:hypothetical protein